MMEKITLAQPKIDDRTLSEVLDVLKSGNLVQGTQVETFENRLCEYTGAKYAIAMNSATSGLFASLMACGVKAGDEVIVPALSYIATANVVEILGATPVFCDIASEGYNLDYNRLSTCLSERTKAVIAVHEFGEPLDLLVLREFCDSNSLVLIEDAACALGTRYNGQHVGASGRAGVFSFHPRKSITCGDGGAVVTNFKETAEALRAIRNHGMENYGGSNKGFYKVGLNFRLTEVQAVMLNNQITKLDEYLGKKYNNVLLYDNLLSAKLKKPDPSTFGHSWQSYHILCKDTAQRDHLIKKLKKQNVYVSLGAQCIPLEPYYITNYGYTAQDFPLAYAASTRGLVLPIHEHVQEKHVKTVTRLINEEV
jgi:perosamine synthetase